MPRRVEIFLFSSEWGIEIYFRGGVVFIQFILDFIALLLNPLLHFVDLRRRDDDSPLELLVA